jgi:hypothetical protein
VPLSSDGGPGAHTLLVASTPAAPARGIHLEAH